MSVHVSVAYTFVCLCVCERICDCCYCCWCYYYFFVVVLCGFFLFRVPSLFVVCSIFGCQWIKVLICNFVPIIFIKWFLKQKNNHNNNGSSGHTNLWPPLFDQEQHSHRRHSNLKIRYVRVCESHTTTTKKPYFFNARKFFFKYELWAIEWFRNGRNEWRGGKV